VDASFSCALDDGILSTGAATGAPALLPGTPERALVADTGEHRLWAFSGTPGTPGACAGSNPSTNNAGPGLWTGAVNPPVTDGAIVYLGHEGSKLSKVPFSGGAFGTVTDAPGFTLNIFNNVALAGKLFFGDRGAPGTYYAYDAAMLTVDATWAGTANAGKMVVDGLLASPVVAASYVFGAAGTNDGHLRAFNVSNGSLAFQWPTAGAGIGNISAVSLGADGVIYFNGDSAKELIPLRVVSSTPALAPGWTASFKGSSTQCISACASDTVVDGLGTEPTIDAGGVLYFGTPAGKVYALITDSGGFLAPTAGSSWPRIGYDNCNSSNTSFNCQ
jgi:outer membrane protein assembly factor BamB